MNKLVVSSSILLLAVFTACSQPEKAAEPPAPAQAPEPPRPALSDIYYLEIKGDAALAEKLVADLKTRDCYVLGDVTQATPEAWRGCSKFEKYESEKQIVQNQKSKVPNTFLYRVTIKAPEKFNLQIFKRDGKEIRRIANGGDFRPKEDFYAELLRTTKTYAFK